MLPCNQIYERIATGELPARFVYKNLEHGVMALLDPYPVDMGHITIATLVCEPTVDDLEPILYAKLHTVAKFAGKILGTAFPEAPYIGSLTAGLQIRHPHIHRVPSDSPATWLKVFSKSPDHPRPHIKPREMDKMQSKLTGYRELWDECTAEIIRLGEPDDATKQAIEDLGIVLPH